MWTSASPCLQPSDALVQQRDSALDGVHVPLAALRFEKARVRRVVRHGQAAAL
jgi:hypothetical protein